MMDSPRVVVTPCVTFEQTRAKQGGVAFGLAAAMVDAVWATVADEAARAVIVTSSPSAYR